jgi:hypothetical protein
MERHKLWIRRRRINGHLSLLGVGEGDAQIRDPRAQLRVKYVSEGHLVLDGMFFVMDVQKYAGLSKLM